MSFLSVCWISFWSWRIVDYYSFMLKNHSFTSSLNHELDKLMAILLEFKASLSFVKIWIHCQQGLTHCFNVPVTCIWKRSWPSESQGEEWNLQTSMEHNLIVINLGTIFLPFFNISLFFHLIFSIHLSSYSSGLDSSSKQGFIFLFNFFKSR